MSFKDFDDFAKQLQSFSQEAYEGELRECANPIHATQVSNYVTMLKGFKMIIQKLEKQKGGEG